MRTRHFTSEQQVAAFWAKVDPCRTDGCWFWTASRNKLGYGRFYAYGVKSHAAHRYAHELLVGPIPDGLEINHVCRQPSCVNPQHLEAVTHQVNMRLGFTGVPSGVQQRAKTMCPYGHYYSAANTYVNPRGERQCRTCVRTRVAAWRRQHLAKPA